MIQIHQDNRTNLASLEAMLHENPEKHIYQLDRAAFTDQQLFDLEMKYIFEGNWIYLAHESQIPNANDFLTSTSAASQWSSPATSKDNSMRWRTPVRTAAPSCAATRRAIARALPARSMAGPLATAASC